MDMYKPTATYKLVYVYTIHDDRHKGKLKVGSATLHSLKSEKQLTPNCPELFEAARKSRVIPQTRTALVEDYDILYTELAIRHIELEDGSTIPQTFMDTDVHDVLKNSGYYPIVFRDSGRDSEWFTVDLDTVIRAIKAFKENKTILSKATEQPVKPNNTPPQITLRAEQEENVVKTMGIFRSNNTMLWDCKMRYGKTVTAYELIKRMGLKRVIVITHRPAVEDSWDTDHDLIFAGTNHKFRDKTKETLDGYDEIMDAKNDQILYDMVNQNIPFTYFASMQDLRHSQRVGGPYNKNNAVFDIDWELVIIDEAHEGTRTDLGEAVIKGVVKENSKVLSLTGTAYDLRKDYGDNVFTWTYVDEQLAKKKWYEEHPDEKNPYADLPTMNILTFNLDDALPESYRFVTTDAAFNFREFFRTWTGDIECDFYPLPEGVQVGDFVYEPAVWSFLNLISRQDETTNYPFSREEYIDFFRHTFWIVPGVKEAKALSALLKRHPFFKKYRVVNVAGDGDAEEPYDLALSKVRKAIAENEYTITISCGRLTTGITVKEWTGIMMLAGSAKTAVNGYMQAIFRVQSPGIINGKQKENCYVFDFAPDRALHIIGEVHRLSSRSKKGEESQRAALGEFLNFCPVIAVEGTEMRYYDVPTMMREIKRISVENAINSGFDDDTIYLSDAGLTRTDLDLEILRKLSDVLTPKKKGSGKKEHVINGNGFTDEQRKKLEKAKRKPKAELTPEEQALLEKEKEERKEQKKLFDLLRAVSIRLPLLFYGADADITEIIHLKDFVDIVDDESWEEFLPKGLSKELFLDISKYYDEDVLVGAGLRIRKLAKAADEYPPTVRAVKIVEIISKFKNPDKETVLTPWRVVNMHMGDTLGGYNFYDELYRTELDEPRFIERVGVTDKLLLNSDVKILELNSKSGLYPLYMAYSIYKYRISGSEQNNSFESLQKIWADVLEKNIFVLCKTTMARSITKRTLAGYTDMKVNTAYFTKLLDRMKTDINRVANKVTNPESWNRNGDRMKFDVIVGNPPYQLLGGSGGSNDSPVYQFFADLAIKVKPTYSALIIPSRWFTAGRENLLGTFRTMMLNSHHIKDLVTYTDPREVFPSVEIKGGICYYLYEEGFVGDCNYTLIHNGIRTSKQRKLDDFDVLIRDAELSEIVKQVKSFYSDSDAMVDSLISNDTPFGISSNPKSSKKNPLTVYAKETQVYSIKLFHIEKLHRKVEYVDRSSITKNTWAIDKHKVFIPGAGGSGNDPYVLGKPEYAPPYSVCSQSYLFAAFDTETEAKNFIKYLNTKLFRVLVSAMKISQSCPNRAYKFVPLQDFTNNSDIDWSLAIPEIDAVLYKKYCLTEDQIKYIEKMINYFD